MVEGLFRHVCVSSDLDEDEVAWCAGHRHGDTYMRDEDEPRLRCRCGDKRDKTPTRLIARLSLFVDQAWWCFADQRINPVAGVGRLPSMAAWCDRVKGLQRTGDLCACTGRADVRHGALLPETYKLQPQHKSCRVIPATIFDAGAKIFVLGLASNFGAVRKSRHG
jgi:hypothetical protein